MDKYSSKPGFAIERIGELALRMKPTALGVTESFATVVAADFDVKIEYRFTPGHAGKLDGPMEDAEEPESDELEIRAIKADANVHFDGDGMTATATRGTDLTALFSGLQITALEDKLLAAKRAEVD